MRILVTGGAGYIGSVVSALLLEEGHQVSIVDDLSKGHTWAVPDGARFEELDLLDLEGLRGVMGARFDGVVHLAASSLVGESVERPVAYYRNNVAATANLLEAMAERGVGRMVFSSTAATYGEPDVVPIHEEVPAVPTNPYGASKLAADMLIGFAARAHGIGAISLRYFNVAGAYGRFGEDHDPETHIIPVLLRVAAGKQEGFEIYGTDYPTEDGTAVRDYIHVEDLARAHLLALQRMRPGMHHIYNLGNGAGFSVRQVLETARRVTGRDIPASEAPRRPGDPPVLVASSRRAAEELGWKPDKPGLEQMIEDAWEFYARRNPT